MILSLCMPTNGISEWVFPALDSIFATNVSKDRFEIIVTDNGNNIEFESLMKSYTSEHENVIYKKTTAQLFDNQLEALKYASGDYFKFVNHRSIWMPDRLEMMIEFLEQNIDEKPVIYFSNGVMGWGPTYKTYNDFDGFVRGLKRYASWTSGVGIWKEDYMRLPEGFSYDKISPHSSVLFSEKKKNKYIINDTYWMNEITTDHTKKGSYDLYKAFGVEELTITLDLYKNGDISADTFKFVRDDYGEFLKELYYQFNIKKDPCSYDLSGFDESMGIFFDRQKIIEGAQQIAREKND